MAPAETAIDPTTTLPARAVTVGEVAQHAKKDHRACHGQGYHLVLSKPGAEPRARPCSCAINRFLEIFGPILERKANGELHWLPGKAPLSAFAP